SFLISHIFHSILVLFFFFFFSSRRRHTRCLSDWSSDVCSSDLAPVASALLWIEAAPRSVATLAGRRRPQKAPASRTGGENRLPRSEERRVGKECRSGWWR